MNQDNSKLPSTSKTVDNFDDQLRDLVIARLSSIPKHIQLSVGSNQYSIEDLVKSVEEGSEIGKQIVEMQLKYLQDLSSGEIYKEFDVQ